MESRVSLEESQDTSIALSHLLANAVSKRVIDTVISKFSSSDTKQTNTNIKPEVLNRLKSLWLDNLASTPDCGLTIPRPSSDTSSSQGPTRGSSFKSARLTDPVPLSPEQYTNRGIRLAAPFLPPPTNPLHSDAALATVQSNSSTVGDSSSGALTKVLQWKHKLVLKRGREEAGAEQTSAERAVKGNISLFPASISHQNTRAAAATASSSSSSSNSSSAPPRQKAVPWHTLSLPSVLKKKRREQMDAITFRCAQLPAHGSLIRYPVTVHPSELGSQRSSVVGGAPPALHYRYGRVTQLSAFESRTNVVAVTVRDASGADSILLLRIDTSSDAAGSGVRGDLPPLAPHPALARSLQWGGVSTGLTGIPETLGRRKSSATAGTSTTTADGEEEAMDLAFDSELQKLLSGLEGEEVDEEENWAEQEHEHEQEQESEEEHMIEGNVSVSSKKKAASAAQQSHSSMSIISASRQPAIQPASADAVHAQGGSNAVYSDSGRSSRGAVPDTVEIIDDDEEVYLRRLDQGVRVRIVGDSSQDSPTHKDGAMQRQSDESDLSTVELAPYEDPLVPIESTPDATLIATFIKKRCASDFWNFGLRGVYLQLNRNRLTGGDIALPHCQLVLDASTHITSQSHPLETYR